MNGLSLRISGGGINKNSKSNSESKLQYFQFSERFSSRYGAVQNVQGLFDAKSVNEQLECLRKIGNTLDSSGDNVKCVLSLLVNLFLEVPVKHPLKNTTARILSTKKLHLPAIEDELSFELLNIISHLDDSKEFLELNNVNTILNSCFDNFTPGVGAVKKAARSILPFLENTLKKYVSFIRHDLAKLSPTEKLELFTYIQNLNRVLLTIIQKCNVDLFSVDSTEVWKCLSQYSTYLIKHGDLPVDTNILCGMIFVTISQLRHGNNVWKYILEIIFDVGDHSDCVIHEEVKDLNSPIDMLCICSSIINIVGTDDIRTVFVGGKPVLTFLSQKLYDLSEKMSVDTTIIIGVARSMQTISRLLFKVTEEFSMINDVTKIILSFIWSHLEYYVDSVRHLSTQILVNIVKISVQLENQGDNKLSNEVFSSVMVLPVDRHSKYKGLATLSSEYGCKHLLMKYPNIVDDLLKAINNITIPANVSVAFETLMYEHNKEVTIDVLFETWIKLVMESLMSYANDDETTVLSMNVLQEILSKGIKLNPALVSLMIPYIMKNENGDTLSDGQFKCTLVCLHVARKTGSFDCDVSNAAKHKWKNIIEYDILHAAVSHQSLEIRLLSLHLFVDTRKTTEFYTSQEFDLLKEFYLYNINVQSPSARQNILALTKKMLKRWKDSFDVLLKSIDNFLNKYLKELQINTTSVTSSKSELLDKQKKMKESYVYFIENLWDFCLGNIFPGANFSRRNISLQILVWCQEFVKSEHLNFIWKDKAIISLIDYLDDSYECNKELVVDLLSYCPVEHLKFNDQEYVKNFLDEAILKASSVKPTDCVTSAYKLSLLLRFQNQLQNILSDSISDSFDMYYQTLVLLMDKLSCEMEVAEANILIAASNGPMYGLLHCIRHILKQINFRDISGNSNWSSLLYNLVKMSFKVNNIVAPVVNNSSPEGHLPMDFNAGTSHMEGNGVILEDGKRVTAQMVLLCAWRSVKEVSLLLGDISYGIETEVKYDISSNLILEIGDHFTTLLSETKHRGAFEQAYLGFSKLCLRLWKSTTESLHSLPGVWLKELITAISGHSDNSKLCATRRSAGVPFMVQALVTTELQVSGNPQCFRSCISTLLNLAAFSNGECNNITVETRTHCLNILRALYRHTALGEHVNPYVAEGLMTAITGFDGATWAERNSSTLLFSSLMTRIFGVQRSKDSDSLCIRNRMTGRIFFLRYPQLYDFILNHLKKVSEHIDGEDFLKPSLYPILLLLARLYPSSLEGTDSNLKLVEYIPYLLACAKCCVLKTRQLAAKAMVPLISHDRYYPHMFALLEILTDTNIKMNYCHGILLQLIRLLQCPPDNCVASPEILQNLMVYLDKTKWILTMKPCFITAESYVQMIYLCLIRFNLASIESNYLEDLCDYLEQPINEKLRIHFGKEKFHVMCLHLQMQYAFDKQNIDQIFHVLNKFKNSSAYEVQSTVLNYLLCLHSESELITVCDQFEIGDIEKSFVTKMPAEIRRQIVDLLHSSYTYENIVNFRDNPQCYQKQLMLISFDNCLSECNWMNLPSKSDTDETRLYYFILQTDVHNNSQIERLIYLRYLNNHFKNIKCLSIHDHYSANSVKILSRTMFDSWSSCDSSVSMNMECVKFINNHWKILNWDVDFKENDRVYAIILQLSSLLKLLDNEEEVVRLGATQIVKNISFKYHSTSNNIGISTCENRAKEILLQLVSEWTKLVSLEFTVFVFIILAFMDDEPSPVENSSDEEYQVFDKEVATYQEKIANVKLCAKFIRENLKTEWLLKGNDEKRKYLLEIVQTQSKDVWANENDICQGSHHTFCLFWKTLASEGISLNKTVSNEVKNDTSLHRIEAFLKELTVESNIFNFNRDVTIDNVNRHEHVYEYMTLDNNIVR